MKKVTVLLTRYSDRMSNFIYHIAGRGYTHASLGLEEEPGVYYSFNYKGFCVETLEKHRQRGVKNSMSCEVEISDSAYCALQKSLARFRQHRAELHYSQLGVAFCLLKLPLQQKDRYFCSQFVAELLQTSGAVPLKKRAELYLPNHLLAELAQSSQLCRLQQNPV